MDKLVHIIISAAVAAMVAGAFVYFGGNVPFERTKNVKESAFARVMRTRTIRCAFTLWPPHFMIDPNTGEKSGVDVEVMEAIGRVTDLKIKWEDEVGVGAAPEQLESGKQDVFCAALWENGRRAQRVETSKPIDYMPLYAYVRENDTRFDGNVAAINNGKVTISLVDGAAQKALADGSFPKARQYSLPIATDATQSFLAVSTGKGDVVFSDAAAIADYNAHNPAHNLRRATGTPALRIYGDVFVTAKGEAQLRDLLSAAITELLNDGTIDRILDKYEIEPGAFFRVAPAYVSKAH